MAASNFLILPLPRAVDVFIPSLACFSLITGLIQAFSDDETII
jgi:hypothetical protein